MKFFDAIQDKCWALRPSKLEEINAFIESRLSGEASTVLTVAGKSGNRADQSYQIKNGTAIIPVYGTIDKRMNMFSDISGGTSCELIQRDILNALENPAVNSILLDVESPGGSVDGPKALADFIFANRGQKPIIAYANGMMASAAYWIASACDAIVANDTAIVGSIGVAMTHRETSVADASNGVKKTEIYAGKYKRLASSTKPLSEEGRAYLQSMVDTYYTLFIESVARNRGVSQEQALAMADGREFIGKQALDVGLVDFIGSMDDALGLTQQRSRKSMDLKTLQEKHPDLFAQVKAMGAEEMGPVIAKAKAEGIEAERARINEILSADGDPAVVAQCIKEGVSSADSFKRLYEAEKKGRADRLEALKTSGPKNPGQEVPRAIATGETFEGEVEKLMAEGKTKLDAMKTIIETKPALHEEYVKRMNKKGA